jgi:CheY-like chemotaxis protein
MIIPWLCSSHEDEHLLVESFARLRKGSHTDTSVSREIARRWSLVHNWYEGKRLMTTILCIDDDPHILALVEKLLTRADYSVLTTADGHEALRILRSQSVDLVIQDFSRPGLNGFEFLKQVKADADLRAIPVLAFTAVPRHLRVQQLERFALDIERDLAGFLTKTDVLDMVDLVGVILNKRISNPPH